MTRLFSVLMFWALPPLLPAADKPGHRLVHDNAVLGSD